MVKDIVYLYRQSNRPGPLAFACSALLGILVFFETAKRGVNKLLPRIGLFQSSLIFGLFYVLFVPVTYVLGILSGEASNSQKDMFLVRGLSSLAKNRKMY